MTIDLATGTLAPGSSLTVLLVEDMQLVREGIKMLIEEFLGHRVIEALSAEEALVTVAGCDADLVMLDVHLPGRDGVWALEDLRRTRPDLPVVMISAFAETAAIIQCLDIGASGFLYKDATLTQMAEAIDTAVNHRGVYVSPAATQRMLAARTADHAVRLTDREIDILRLLVEGATNEEIASRLFIASKTVKTHITSLFKKLGVTNRTQAATKAVGMGLISVDRRS